MLNRNIPGTDEFALVGAIDPDAYAAGSMSTAWVSMAIWAKVSALISAGDLGASGTLDAKLEQATSAAGAGAKDITGKAITQLTKVGTDDNKQAWINCRADELDIENGFTHVRLTMAVGTATSDAAGYLFAMMARYGTAADNDAASVDEIVA